MTAKPFVVNIRPLRATTGTRHELHLSGLIGGLSIPSAEVPPGAEVRFDGWMESAIGGVTVAGTVTAAYRGTCRRCLEPAVGEVAGEVREFCSDGSDRLAEDTGDYVVGTDVLDVEPIVHDACILELPLAPLCSESCLGLCPTCGINRNRDTCSCEQPIDRRWSALTELVGIENIPNRGSDDDGRPEEEDFKSQEP